MRTHKSIVNVTVIVAQVGPQMGTKDKVADVLRLLESVPISVSEELVLNTVSLVTNLTYYASSSSVLWERRLECVPILARMLFVDNHEAVLEAARAFGNLSRCPAARTRMRDTRVDEALVLLLDHSDPQVLAAAAGVVVNLAGDKECMSEALLTDALVLLLDALGRAGTGLAEVEATCTVCHGLFNVSASLDWQLDGLVASQIVVALEQLLAELAEAMPALGTQGGEALAQVAQRLMRAIKSRCGPAMASATADMEALQLEQEALDLRHAMSEAEAGEYESEDQGGEVRVPQMVSMLEPLEGAREEPI